MADTARILIVDDEPTLLTVLASVLEDVGFDVKTCASGEDALRELRRERFDLLLADKNLPQMNGIDLAREARLHHSTRSLMITGYPSTASLIEAINAGVAGYLVKPFESLDAAVAEVRKTLQTTPRGSMLEPGDVLEHLRGKQTLAPLPSVVIVATQATVRERALAPFGRSARAFAAVELGVAAIVDQTPQIVASDDVEDLAHLIRRAPRACAWYLGPRPAFDTALQLLRIGSICVAGLDEVAGEATGRP